MSHREWADYLAWSHHDDEAIREYAGTMAEIKELLNADPVEQRRAILGLAELRAARGEDQEAQSLAERALDLNPGLSQAEVWERKRTEFVLGVVLACRNDLDRAATLLDGSAEVAILGGVGTMPQGTWARMADRIIVSYQQSAEPGFVSRLKAAIASRQTP